jgi:hypothetical protein
MEQHDVGEVEQLVRDVAERDGVVLPASALRRVDRWALWVRARRRVCGEHDDAAHVPVAALARAGLPDPAARLLDLRAAAG